MLVPPQPSEFNPYYKGYIDKVKDEDLMGCLEGQKQSFRTLVEEWPKDKLDYKYAEDKWTVKEVLTHINDIERIFAYRLVTVLRGEKKSIPGFDENEYIRNANINHRIIENFITEFSALRNSSIALCKSVQESDWTRAGNFNGSSMSARAIAYMMPGHVAHHLDILNERYRS